MTIKDIYCPATDAILHYVPKPGGDPRRSIADADNPSLDYGRLCWPNRNRENFYGGVST